MRWVYILKCSDDYYYVGETKRLYRRFWEHQEGNGGINTSSNIPESIVSIYKVSTLCKFFEYDNIVMNKIMNNPKIAIYIIINIFNTMKRKGTLHKLSNKRLGFYFMSEGFQSFMLNNKRN